MPKLLYVTSFNRKLYKATGRHMLQSFLATETEGDMLITHEDGVDVEIEYSQKFLFYNLDTDPFLREWLDENIDIIPIHLGGTFAGEFKNKFHRRASQWFRKIAALRHAVTLDYDQIIFVDSDTVFKQQITSDFINHIFNDKAVFYHFGKQRRHIDTGWESGVIGFQMNRGGRRYLELVFDAFRNKKFMQYKRWDDSWMFRKVAEENPEIETVDIAQESYSTHVVPEGALRNHIVHNKGIHWRKHDVEGIAPRGSS